MEGVKSIHFRKLAFLIEISTQCLLAKRAFNRLKKSAKAKVLFKEYEGETGAPIEILHLVHSFLTYAAVIAKIIFARGRNNKVILDRCSELRDLLEIRDCPNLANLKIRNSFEHIDERYDEYVPEPPCTFQHLAIGKEEDRNEKTVIRRFDPYSLEFWFLDEYIKILPLMEEINHIESMLKPAIGKLEH